MSTIACGEIVTLIEHAVCPSCGCLCDDIVVEVKDGRIAQARHACANGRSHFSHYDATSRYPTVGGQAVDWDAAIAEAARILCRADSPLIFGLSSTATEAQCKAVELAERLGAMVDSTSSVCHGPAVLAMQTVGLPGCTLGEVRNRADLVIFWGCNPAVSHPRHFARYSLPLPKRGYGVLTGKRRYSVSPLRGDSRKAVVVDVRPTPSSAVADSFFQIAPGSDYEALTTLRALVQGKDIYAEAVGGVPLARWRELAAQMKACRFGVVFAGLGLTMSPGRDLNVSELVELVSELNVHTHFSVIPMRGHGNVTGADQVLTWQSGYPFAVHYGRGYPRYGPGEFSAVDVLARGECDAALIIASDPAAHLPHAAAQRLNEIPVIVLDPRPSLTAQVARVVLPTACYGVDAAGTFYRMDGVPIRLRAVLPPARPSDEQVLDHLLAAVRDVATPAQNAGWTRSADVITPSPQEGISASSARSAYRGRESAAMLGILGGQVYDPLHGVNGEVRDLWVKDGRIVSAEAVDRDRAEIIRADGMVVMPGGVDIHSHIAGPKVNAARRMCPEDHRDDVWPCPAISEPCGMLVSPSPQEGIRSTYLRCGVGRSVPTTFVTGYHYARMGYTTVMEAAMPALLARHTHRELADTPIVDKGAYTLMGNNRFLMQCLRDGERDKARDFIAWLLGATKGYAVKIVNAGGVESWKAGRRLWGLDDLVAGFDITPRQIILTLADISAELGLPHGPHLHTNGLGRPGNAGTTLQTIAALEGRRAHIAHLQFASYGGGEGQPFCSAATEVAQAMNEHPNLTADIGQIIFGPTTTLTADAPLEQSLHQLSGHKWLNHDVEEETGGGAVPMAYRRTDPVNAIQWCIGLELLLQITDPWQVFLTTDHPNAGPFTAYPEIIRLAMDRNYRAEVLQTLPPRVEKRTILADLKREYSLYEIAIITRAGTARALGLEDKGHLGIGADADIAVYTPDTNPATMFSRASWVVKGGRVVIREGELVDAFPGRTFCVAPPWDARIESALRAHFEASYTVSFDNYPVQDEYVPHSEVVPCA